MRALILLSLLTACAPGQDTSDGPGDTAVETVDGALFANALGVGGHPILPYPASPYAAGVADDRLPNGFTRELTAGGASRVTAALTWLEGGVAPASLPDGPDASLAGDAAVRVLVKRDDGWVRHPVFAEIDASAADAATASLILRPYRPYPARARVAVVLTTALDTASGAAHTPTAPTRRLLDDDGWGARDAERAWLQDGIADDLREAVAAEGLTTADVVQAWTFDVRDDGFVDHTLQMQDLSAAHDPTVYTVEDVAYEGDKALVYGTVEVPWYLDEDDRVVVEEGQVVEVERRDVPFLITIPDTVRATRPVVLFGHGFFSAIEEPTWSNLFNGLQQWEMSAITTRFYGFAEADLGKAAFAIGGETFDGLNGIMDLQRQSEANFTVVHRLVADHLADEVTVDFGDGPFKPLSATEIPYMGISNGGTQGFTMMATSPRLERGALIVPGGGWSHMLQRAAQWATLGEVFVNRFDTEVEIQLGSVLTQTIFDPADSLNYAEHLVNDRYPGREDAPGLLVVEAVNDSQVANLVTRWVTGTAGIPRITPNVAEVWGVDDVAPGEDGVVPSPVAFESYDLGVPDNPEGNVAPTENGVHDDVRRLDSYRAQLGPFLEDGTIVRTCDGVCDPD